MTTIRRIALLLLVLSFGLSQPLFAATVNIANGNLYDERSVSPLPKLAVTIAYNSRSTRESVFGYGWNASFDIRLLINSNGSCVLVDSDGKERLFTPTANGSFTAAADVHDTLEKLSNAYRLNRKGGGYVGFDSKGLPLAIVDTNGNTLSLSYSGTKLTGIIGPSGDQLSITTDSNGRITALTGAGKSTTFVYDNNKNLGKITDAAGQSYYYTYDANHNRLTTTTPLGDTTQYAYDSNNRLISSTNAAGDTKRIEYPATSVSRFIDPQGNTTEYTVNSNQHITQKKDAAGNIISNTWDAAGNRTSTTDASGTVTMTYDSQGNLLSRTNQLGQTTSYTYNTLGQPLTIRDAQGNTTSNSYDSHGNLTAYTDAAGATSRYQYDNRGQIIAVTDSNNRTTSFVYDTAGNVVGVTDPLGAKTTLGYNTAGDLISITDAARQTTSLGYDQVHRLTSVTDAKGSATRFQYDAVGNRTAVTDAKGNTTAYAYDHLQRVTAITDALGQKTILYYVNQGCTVCSDTGQTQPTALTDANGHTTWFQYDSLGRLVQEIDQLGARINYQYDAAGNMVARTDALGRTTSYSYDAVGRLLTKIYPDRNQVVYKYDTAGRLISAANQYIGYVMGYDNAGRLLAITDSSQRTVRYQYDAAGNRVKMTTPEGKAVQYHYDGANRLDQIASYLGTFAFGYDTMGRRTGLGYPNGASISYGYDSVGQLTSLLAQTVGHKGRNELVNAFSYTLDAIGNRVSKSVTWNEHQSNQYDYTYDALSQLIEILDGKSKEKSSRKRIVGYVYDRVGNRVTGPGWNDLSTYNEVNQLVTRGRASYRYDRNGNLIAKDGWSYSYDYENRLIKATKTDDGETKAISFKYDPFGRRIEKKIEEIGGGRTEARTATYVYDNEDIILEYRTGAEENGSERDRIKVSRYVHGPGIDEPLAVEQKGQIYYYHADGLGSVVRLTDQRGRVVQSFDYSAFGMMQQQGNEVKQPYTYTGREWDKELGLYYYRARYYDPAIGRFISKDPIGFNGGDVNLYRYVGNGPVNAIDPYGESPLSCLKCFYYMSKCAQEGLECKERLQTNAKEEVVDCAKNFNECYKSSKFCQIQMETCAACGLFPHPVTSPTPAFPKR